MTDTGANASAEEADEGSADQVETVLDVKQGFRLTDTQFSKKDYLSHLKGESSSRRLPDSLG